MSELYELSRWHKTRESLLTPEDEEGDLLVITVVSCQPFLCETLEVEVVNDTGPA